MRYGSGTGEYRLGGLRVRRSALVWLAIVASAGASSVALAAPAGAAPEVTGHAGRWLTDSAGRVVVVHGVDVSSKGYAAAPAYPAGIGFGGADAQLLADNGLDAVRITFERYAFEPRPGQFDDAYLAHIKNTMRLLWQYGIYSEIDFHQD